jgi:hypothetical protein
VVRYLHAKNHENPMKWLTRMFAWLLDEPEPLTVEEIADLKRRYREFSNTAQPGDLFRMSNREAAWVNEQHHQRNRFLRTMSESQQRAWCEAERMTGTYFPFTQ